MSTPSESHAPAFRRGDSRDVIIGLDSGTSVVKAVAFTVAGEQLAVTARPNAYGPSAVAGGVEQDMARTWADAAGVLKALGEAVPDLARRTAAIAVTGQGDGTFLIDRAGEPVMPAFLWLDARAAAITRAVIARPDYAERHYRVTGSSALPCQQGMQMLWLDRHAPEALDRAATAFHCKDWLYFNLTGERVTDPSEATFTFGDYRTAGYSEPLIEWTGLGHRRALLPPIVDGVRQAGSLSAAGAAATGLLAGTPVTLGYVDVVCTCLGGGLYDPSGRTGCTIIGSTGMHMKLSPDVASVRLNDDLSGYTMMFPEPGMRVQMQSTLAATLNIDWALDLVREAMAAVGVEKSRRELIQCLDEQVLAAPPGMAIYHPYISEAGERGPFFDADARAQFTGLSSRVGFAGLMRTIYEGLALSARDGFAAMGDVPAALRLAGGSARSVALKRILAAALGAEVAVIGREEAGAAGAAMMAAVSLGLYPSMREATAAWVEPLLGPAERPDAALAPLYDALFEVYRDLRTAMPPTWARLAAIRNGDPR